MVTETGNSLLPPPRRTGDTDQDLSGVVDWINDLFRSIALEANVIGATADNTARLAALTERVAAAEEKLAAIRAIAFMVGPIVEPYDPQQLADAYDKINAIINAAG